MAGPAERTTASTPGWTAPLAEAGFGVDLADWDGDGDLDLAVANDDPLGADPNRVYRNEGDGSFTAVATFGQHGQAVAWGDWDGDGDPDLAVAEDSTWVYRNQGGTLTLAWTDPTPDRAFGLDWGDYDGDGDLDLAVARFDDPNRVFRNTGGNLVLAWTGPVAEGSKDVDWVDIDGDGQLELAFANADVFGAPNRVYRWNGVTFTESWESTQSEMSQNQVFGDLDGDGLPDVVVASQNAPLRVYRGTGTSFVLHGSYALGDDVWAVDLGDDDGDGDLDVFVGRRSAEHLLLTNDGAGGLSLGWSDSVAADVTDLAAADLDGDGDLDHVTCGYREPVAAWWGGDGVCDLRVTSTGPGRYPAAFAFGDADGDGDPDLATFSENDDGWFENVGGQLVEATFTSSAGIEPDADGVWTDVDLDGDLDLIEVGTGDTYALTPSRVWANDGFGGLTLRQTLNAEFSQAGTVADVDGDGDEDLYVANRYGCTLYQCTSGRDRLYRNDAGTLVSAWRPAAGDPSLSAAFGDVDGDGDPDLYVGNQGADRLYRNDAGAFTEVWTSAATTATSSVAFGDVDGDGDLDVATGSTSTGARVYENVAGALVEGWFQPGDAPARAVALGDWDADGVVDLAAGGRVSVGDATPITVSRLEAGNTWTELWTTDFAIEVEAVAFADLDLDGVGDLAMLVPSDEVVVVNPADTDADGLADVCESLHVEAPRPLSGTAEVVVLHADPLARVHLVGGLRQGTTAVPGCPGSVVDLANPQVVGTATASVTGVVTLQVPVPAGASGHAAWLQAVDTASCTVGDPLRVDVP